MTAGAAREWLRDSMDPAALAARQFLYASLLSPMLPFSVELAQKLFPDERPVLEGARAFPPNQSTLCL